MRLEAFGHHVMDMMVEVNEHEVNDRKGTRMELRQAFNEGVDNLRPPIEGSGLQPQSNLVSGDDQSFERLAVGDVGYGL